MNVPTDASGEADPQNDVISTLSIIDEICQSSEIAGEQAAVLWSKVEQVLRWIDANFQLIETEVAQQLLDFLRAFSEAKDFEVLFKSSTASFLVCINSAYMIQQSWKDGPTMQENHSLLKRSIKILKRSDQFTEASSNQEICAKHKLNLMLAKMYLQLAASYSQFGFHKKAIQVAKKSFVFLTIVCHNLKNLLLLGSSGSTARVSPEVKELLAGRAEIGREMLIFFDYQRQLSDSLERVLTRIELNELDSLDLDAGFGLEKLAFKSHPSKIVLDSIKDFTIAHFMHIEYVTLESMTTQPSLSDLLQKELLSNLVSLCATVLFAIATENRFICLDSYGMGSSSFKIKSVFEKNHQQRVKRIMRFSFSQRLHAQSITFLQAYFKNSPLLLHLTSSFEKNYGASHNLEDIVDSSARGRRSL